MQDNPRLGEILGIDRVTPSENPFSARTAIVDVPLLSVMVVTDPGLDCIVKSCTVTVTIVDSETWPLVPVTWTTYVPKEPIHDRVETSAVCTFIVDREHESPACDDTVS